MESKMDMKELSSELFNLADSVEQLGPINDGVVHPQYRQVSCQKAVEGDSFPSGQQVFRFNVSGSTWWCPSKTFMSFRVALTNTDGSTINMNTKKIALNMGTCANLYQSAELRMGGKVVQRVSQYMAQVDSLLHRTTKSNRWLEEIGESTNSWSELFYKRGSKTGTIPGAVLNVEDENYYALGAGKTELIWKPCLPLFHTFDGCLPAGDYEIVLTPQPKNSYTNQVVEIQGGSADDLTYKFEVERVHLNVATIEGPRVDSKQYAISLDHVECQASKVLSTSLSQQYFSVSPATKALCVAYQDNRLSAPGISASKFQISESNDNGGLTLEPDIRFGANELKRLYIQYDGIQRPQPDADPEYDTPSTLRVQEGYYKTQAETGMLYDEAGPERLSSWLRRGPFYYFNWNRDTSSGATRVQVSQQFNSQLSPANYIEKYANLLLFSVSETSAVITIRNGEITSVEQIDR